MSPSRPRSPSFPARTIRLRGVGRSAPITSSSTSTRPKGRALCRLGAAGDLFCGGPSRVPVASLIAIRAPLRSARATPAASQSDYVFTAFFAEARRLAGSLSADDDSLHAERTRGTVMSHPDWLAADAARLRLQQQWSAFFREWDVAICPAAAIPVFPHDHSEPIETRPLDIDGKTYPYYDVCFIWADPASACGLPATAAPIDRSATGLPFGVQIIGPYLEDRTTIAFAELLEREFGGFVPPL